MTACVCVSVTLDGGHVHASLLAYSLYLQASTRIKADLMHKYCAGVQPKYLQVFVAVATSGLGSKNLGLGLQ